ncbi:growth-regulating factor 9-like isoform X2 [Lotus japonicus]|uniref:growth-regulating factor 9-like isoform X2 n=1 Tax=Lotus japonicus TaxID=34305 RepID=UPI002587B118|nr:growth-regulating factor 9-like isoform X2 [Lotus japonicus]
MEAKPLQVVPSPHNNSGDGPQMKIEDGVVDEGKKGVVVKGENSSSSVEHDLGVSACSAVNTERHQKCCLFSDFQRRELDHQVFIFNRFASNLPLPHHMLQFPSHMSENLGFDYGTMVDDPEPHRCRRTDGRKWRCGKNTVPDQKYCERHMHRGRNRSRKPVEKSSEVNSSLTTKPCGNMSHAKPAPSTESAVSSPNNVTIHEPPSTQSSIVNTSSLNSRSRNVTGSADYQSPLSPAVAPKLTTFSSMASVTPHNRSHLNVHNKKDEQNSSCISNKISIYSSGKGSIVCDSNGISTGIGFSPRSVLQVSGCNHAYLNYRNNVESEAGRCRRTDGKKWRCKGCVLPGQKYCATHVNRGAKKRVTSHEPAATTTSTTYPSATTNNIQKAQITNLSMSVPAASAAAAAFTECNVKSASSNDTDITISDTINECNNYLSS